MSRNFSSFLLQVFKNINFSFRHWFSYIPKGLGYCIFIFTSTHFKISLVIYSLTYWFVTKSMLFNFHTFMNFPNFFVIRISNFILLWSENILCMVSILLNLLKVVLWPRVRSVLENVSCILRRVCILQLLGRMFYWYLSFRSSWFIVISLLVPCCSLSSCSSHYWNWNEKFLTPYFYYWRHTIKCTNLNI